MEIICKRFPTASDLILKYLDDKSLVKSKEASRDVAKYLDNERFYWIRILKKNNCQFRSFEESWNQVIIKTPLDIIKQLTLAVKKNIYGYKNLAPLHIAAKEGSIKLCEYIITKTSKFNPVGEFGLTPLHLSIHYHKLDVFRLIFERAENKNPADERGRS